MILDYLGMVLVLPIKYSCSFKLALALEML